MRVTTTILERRIQKYGLQPATQRELSLFTLSCVSYGYTKLLRGMIGISVHAVGGLGQDDWWHSMFNEAGIVRGTRDLLLALRREFVAVLLTVAHEVKHYQSLSHYSLHGWALVFLLVPFAEKTF